MGAGGLTACRGTLAYSNEPQIWKEAIPSAMNRHWILG